MICSPFYVLEQLFKSAQEWQLEIEEEYEEVRREQEGEQADRVSAYLALLDQWKEMHARRREAHQRHKKHQRDMERGRGSVDADTFAADEELLAQPEPEKPTQPAEFDPTKVRQEPEKKNQTEEKAKVVVAGWGTEWI